MADRKRELDPFRTRRVSAAAPRSRESSERAPRTPRPRRTSSGPLGFEVHR